MSVLQNKIIRNALAGAVGGFIGWVFSEPVALMSLGPSGSGIQAIIETGFVVAIVGAGLGAVLGAAEGLSLRSVVITLRGAVLGAVIGFVGGAIGGAIAQVVYQPLVLSCFCARGIAWSVFGFFLGTSEGIRRFSLIGLRNATIGGAIGGFIGGVLFDVVGAVIGFIGGGTFSRAIGFVVLGMCIGILIAFVERVLAQGAFRVVAGRQEGREILLDKPRVVIGRDERNDIYMSDHGIEKQHAEVRAERGGFAINALNGTLAVNGNPITHHLLQSGDEVQLGDARLRYRARGEGMPLSRRLPASPSQPTASQIPGERNCPRCAHTNRANAKFCARCGYRF